MVVPVYDSAVSLTKIADVIDAIAGEFVLFTIVIQNDSTRTLNQALLSDVLAEYYQFISGSVVVQGVRQPYTTPYAITIGVLEPGERIVISYRALITYVPDRIMTSTQASLSYQVSSDPSIISSNIVHIELFPSAVQLSKESNVSTVIVGSRVTYYINAVHFGVFSGQLLLIDKLPSEVEFISGSLVVNGELRRDETPETGIKWDPFMVGQLVRVSFDVTVKARPLTGKLVNEVDALFTVQLPSGRKAVSTYDAQAEQIVVAEPLVVRKSASTSAISLGEEVGYTIAITNVMAYALNELFVVDLLPSSLQLVLGSVAINGWPDPNVNDLTSGIQLGTIEAGATITIAFRARLTQYEPNMLITNQAAVHYWVEYNRGSVLSNIVTIVANPDPPKPPPPVDPKLRLYVASPSITEPVFVGSVINFQYILENISEDDLFQLLLKFTMNQNGAFVIGSLYVNGISLNDNPFDGFIIPQLKIGERIEVRFQIRIVGAGDGSRLVVGASADYNYRGINGAVISEQVVAIPTIYRLYDASVDVVKFTSAKVVMVGDIIQYDISIQNTGNIPLNLTATDKLASNLKLIPNKLTVNGVIVNDRELSDGITILDAEPGVAHRIRFTAVVTYASGRAISNAAFVVATAIVDNVVREFSYHSNTIEIKLVEDEE
ncbi:DUF11 domain-containing protein [Paenibacillus agilis]|uniref:DUF11 domain-containing protein n=1 Tax=Paenibacillus agilis TaxID=3020863 RepID=A0A559IZA6_9BACL|nr:DUF11 domain-containing protein [Paenibacillus agilis]TVX92937.1 DUF11 domain-containing protein [Paenibacillus agilis]